MVLSPDLRIATPRFIFEYLRSVDGQHQLLASTSQTGVPAIARPTTSLKAMRLVLPPVALLRCFEAGTDPFADSSVARVRQCRTLAALRNVLLPKLVSGELRIKDVEKIVAGTL
jgi:type I restriction enzyme S subunit